MNLLSYMKLDIRYTILYAALAASAAIMPCEMHAYKELVTTKNISATKEIADDHMPSNLLVDNDKKYHTIDDDPTKTFEDGEQYLQVDLENPLSLGDEEDLIVFVQRCHTCLERQPTAFRVEGYLPSTNIDTETESDTELGAWEQICHIYFLYRGRNTKEYSARFHPKKNYTKLRFYVTENNSRNYDAAGHPSMGLRQFQVYQIGRNETLGGRKDPIHLESDFKTDYAKYTFDHTKGWLDPINRDYGNTSDNKPSGDEIGTLNHEAHIKGEKEWQQTYIDNIDKWAHWTDDWTEDGKWRLDLDKLEEFGIKMPEMSLITGDADFDSEISPDDPSRQPTHVSEHILYALPGDPIILYPYYKFANPLHYEQYEVNFAHWYDYRTGGSIIYDDKNGNKMDMLGFVADPSQVCMTDNHGYYGAYLLTEKNGILPGRDSRNYGMFATFFCPRNPDPEDGEGLSLPFRNCDKAKAGSINDVDEFVIAADFSQSFNKGRNLDDEHERIIEPAIAFRHIFRIRDGKKFADDFSGNETANKNYIDAHTRQVTARANEDFQIGLEGAVPKPIKGQNDWWRSVPSKYYYKAKDNDYRRIVSMAIRVTEPNNTVTTYSHEKGKTDPYNPSNLFYFDAVESSFKGLGSRKINEILNDKPEDIFYGIAGGGVCEDKEDEDIVYCRLLKSDKARKLSGHYTVEILGEEIIGNNAPSIIKVHGSDRELVVMKYEIDFVESPQAFLITGTDLYKEEKIEGTEEYKENIYKFAREEELISKYGEPKDKIDFDYYRSLETLDNWAEYLNGDKDSGKFSFKWPLSWKTSNYGFGYADGHNYNMYAIANHSSKVKWKKKDDVYDMLRWKNDNLKQNSVQANSAEGDDVTDKKNNNGYFLYVNAANDPGVMIRLDAGTLCTGSTINVSAWVVELSENPEKANIAFNLVAVLAGTGERINVHTFVSGYVPTAGEWYKIFYSFQPDVDKIGYTSAQIDHYELELENNCKSSDGADYAIDEIAIYIVTPEIGAEQEIPICLDVDAKTDQIVKISAPFGPTLRSSDITESTSNVGKDVKLSYVILDKEKFETAYNAVKDDISIDDPGATAFGASGVIVKRGEVEFSSYYTENPEFTQQIALNTVGRYIDERETRMIAFKVDFDDENFSIGKEYYIAIYAYAQKDGSKIGEIGWKQYNLTDPCAKRCIFKVAAKNSIRLDGEVREQTGPLKVCEGEKPVISIDLKTAGADDNTYTQGARCDWFNGTKEAFDSIEDESGLTLYKAMTYFREAYPEAIGPEDETVKHTDNFFTEAMLDLIKANKGKFVFSASKYEFDRLVSSTEEVVVTALPIPYQDAESNQTVCTSPMEIKIEVVAKAPSVLHGLRDVDYPAGLDDVPLRIGLDQLRSVSMDKEKDIAEDQMMLVIPLRKVETSGVVEKVESFSSEGSSIVMLESTTDPNDELQPQTVTSSSGETYIVKPEVAAGIIKNFAAETKEGSNNEFSVVFYDSFPFREGYEYTFSYQFKENMPEGEDHVCQGKDVFTIKVVPEYLVWTPEDDTRNWNNDGNWQRVGSDALLAEFATEVVKTRLNDKVTDGSNSNTGAYVPMDFTKVIIPATTATSKSPFMYDWGVETAEAGAATELIEYDMVAKETEGNVECGLWYANTCEQIHFLPNASIMNQQHLKYEMAWVDLELTPSRWYTLAMPLKKVFAGEFYLPTLTARQQTELFQPITYDKELNDRFNPAVFQRGWDKGKADIYHTDGSKSTAVVAANWSHVYNDVQESYGSGVGFSIKTDVSRFDTEKAPEKVLFRLPKADTEYGYYEVDKKDDGLKHNIDHGTDHYKLNEANGKITATTAGTATAEVKKYFLVGNPFMTCLDMEKFLKANEGKVAQKYWMITAGTQKMGVFDPESSDGLVGNAEGYVAPMQGFFVELKDGEEVENNTLSLEYSEEMMYDASGASGSAPLKIASRSHDEGFTLTISALNYDEESTAAVVRVSADASCGYVAEEDMVVIDNSDLEVRATVYTVGDGKALAVNSLDGIGNVELGLIALPEEETVLRFNIDEECALNLYDAETGTYTPIVDGMTYPVRGNVSGRLYLTASSSVKSIGASGISWSAAGDELTVRSNDAACSRLSVRLIDYAGRCVAAKSVDSDEITMQVSAGVYVLEAETESERLCVGVKF